MHSLPGNQHESGNGRVLGLATLRIVALALITWQHAASSVLDSYAATQWRGISPGQSGVAMFCAISGYLAFRTRPANILLWFKRRLLTIFPAYWIVTVCAFALAAVWGTKQITIGLFVSQMLGLGYFTHGWELVNVVSWFISLILLCYGLSFLAWWLGPWRLFWWFVLVGAVILVSARLEVGISRHLLAFGLGALLSDKENSIRVGVISGVLIVVGVSIDPQLFYSGAAVMSLLLATYGKLCEPRFLRMASAYSYQYFLVHGICLVVVAKLFTNGFVAIFFAIPTAMIGAVCLYQLERVLPLSRRVEEE